jgi:hypothetical protein
MSNLLNDLIEFFEAKDYELENIALQRVLIEYVIILTDKSENQSLINDITSTNQYLFDKMTLNDDEECQYKMLMWCDMMRLINSKFLSFEK